MFFWNSLTFSMIQWMLPIWSLVPLPFLNPAWICGSSQFMYCWRLAWRIFKHNLTSMGDECNCPVVWTLFSMFVSLPCHGEEACAAQWSYEPCWVGLSKTDGSYWRVLTKCDPLEEGMGNHPSILAMRTPWTVKKGKIYDLERWAPQVRRCPVCYWGRVEENY